jgi:hypothetical protein
MSVRQPAARINRRIQMWDMSCGFSLDGVDDIKQFVVDLRNSADPVLIHLSYCNHSAFHDWVNACKILREREHEITTMKVADNAIELRDAVLFDLEVTNVSSSPATVVKVTLNARDRPSDIAAKVFIRVS